MGDSATMRTMLVEYGTQKLYYGFPVFILGYEDDKHGMNITTCTSSYSLRNTVSVGMLSTSNAAHQMKESGRFSMNVIDEGMMAVAEFAGIKRGGTNKAGRPGTDKLQESGVDFQAMEGLPVLSRARIVLLCDVVEVHEFDQVTHFTASISKRLIDDSLLDEKGHFIYRDFNPVIYEGDTRRRMYRFIENGEEGHEDILPFGSYARAARGRKGENQED